MKDTEKTRIGFIRFIAFASYESYLRYRILAPNSVPMFLPELWFKTLPKVTPMSINFSVKLFVSPMGSCLTNVTEETKYTTVSPHQENIEYDDEVSAETKINHDDHGPNHNTHSPDESYPSKFITEESTTNHQLKMCDSNQSFNLSIFQNMNDVEISHKVGITECKHIQRLLMTFSF